MSLSKIIILIPHFNNVKELLLSIKSIDETIPVDILIIDDGSSNKPSKEELQDLYSQGELYIEYLQENLGIEKALNVGLSIIEKEHYKYIGRLDCGDINYKNKYTKQVTYLDDHPDTYLLGTWVELVDVHGNFLYTLKHPTEYKVIKKRMYLNSMFVHPSVVYKTEVLSIIGNYPVDYKAAEDYAYFFDILKKLKVENYPEVLLLYKVDNNSISSQKRRIQVKNRIRIILKHFYVGYWPIYGLIRNVPLFFMSRKLTTWLKQWFKKE